MEDTRKAAIDWFNSDQEYFAGLDILRRVSKKHKVIGKLVKRGDTPTNREKLIWELNKVAGLKVIPKPSKHAKKSPRPSPAKKTPKDVLIEVGSIDDSGSSTGAELIAVMRPEKEHLIDRDIDTYPPVIRKVVNEYSYHFKERSKDHHKLVALPDDNTEGIISERLELMQSINAHSERMEVLHAAFEAFNETGDLPDEGQLFGKEQKKDKLTVIGLKKAKKNLISSLTKDRNLLLYNQKVKPEDGKESPMPEGAKRIKVERRIEKKEKQIQDLDIKIAKME